MANIQYSHLKKVRTTLLSAVILIVAIGIYLLSLYMVGSHPMREPQPVRVAEEILTLQMKPSVLISALEERANEWCNVERRSIINSTIEITPSETGTETFDRVFLTDSVAPVMARDYPHLFEYTETDGQKMFALKAASRSHVTVPVWLIKKLIDMNVLILPPESTNN